MKGNTFISSLTIWMVVPFIQIRIMARGGLPYIKVIPTWAVTRFQGVWSLCRELHSTWIFCSLLPDTWLLVTPGRGRIAGYMVLTWLPVLTRSGMDVTHQGSEYAGWPVTSCVWSGSNKWVTPIMLCLWKSFSKHWVLPVIKGHWRQKVL